MRCFCPLLVFLCHNEVGCVLLSKFNFSFLAQLWRFNEKNNLENKLRTWTYSTSESSFLSKDDKNGHILVHEIDQVLTLKNEFTGEIGYENKSIASQNWILGQKDKYGWRTIKHSKTGLFLTARLANKFAKLKAELKG